MSPAPAGPHDLLDAAFGAGPGLHPLPAAGDELSRWWRSVALGGQGRYAAAAAELSRLDSAATPPGLRSLAVSTRASHLRQLGGHRLARALDGRALVLARAVVGRAGATARCDALVGLAADALGPGRLRLSRRLLDLAADDLDEAEWRCRVRWHWVAAENDLCADDRGAARGHAGTALHLAEQGPAVRHRVKSLLVQAAATGSVDDAERAVADAVEHDLLPLQWASTMLLLALSSPRNGSPVGGRLREESTASHRLLTLRGGMLPGVPTPQDLA